MNATAKEISVHVEQPAVPATNDADTLMRIIERAVMSPDLDIAKLDKLLDVRERWEANQARKAFDEAMANAKAEIPTISKNRQVGFDSKKAGSARTDYRHEDLAEIARTVDPILGKHGLSYRFRTTSNPNEPITVTCIVSHRLGHSESNTLVGPRDDTGNKNSIQQIGSTITYLQRYTLKAALGLAASNDDDGKASGETEDGPISEAQRNELLNLISDTGTDIERFCRAFKIEAVAELQESKYETAVARLKEKKAAK